MSDLEKAARAVANDTFQPEGSPTWMTAYEAFMVGAAWGKANHLREEIVSNQEFVSDSYSPHRGTA